MAARQRSFGSNYGLLDARGTAQIFHTLASGFRAVEFADFCTVAEEIVLRDRIVLVGKYDMLPAHLRRALKPLIDAGVFLIFREPFRVPDLPQDPRQLDATDRAIRRGLTSATKEDANNEARRLIGGEAHLGIAATPQLRGLQHFALLRRPMLENTVWDLAGQYRSISLAANELRRRYQTLPPMNHIPVPPIALRAIQRSRHFDEVLANVLQLRDEFAPLRGRINDIEAQFREGNLSPADALAPGNYRRLKGIHSILAHHAPNQT